MTELTIGAGQEYSTISAAVAASRDGDVLLVQAGTYVNDFAEINASVTLKAVGGMVHLHATIPPPDGKAILTTNADVTIDGFEFSGAAVRDLNGAGIRQQGGDLTIIDSWFHHNQMGILTNQDPTATLTIRSSEFDHNVASGSTPASGLTHNLYVGHIAKLTIEDSYFHDAALGHQIKSRAAETVITGTRIVDGGGTASYSIDLPNGGRAVLSGNVIEQGRNSENPVVVAFGEEGGVPAGSSIEVRGNIVVNDLAGGGTLLWNAAGAPAVLTANQVFGLGAGSLLSGPGSVSGTNFLTSAPVVDVAHPWTLGGASGIAGQVVTGTTGRDMLVGGAGPDTITGLGGRDVMTGGAGADHFVWTRLQDRVDRITDFNAAEGDALDLAGVFAGNPHPGTQAGLVAGGFVRLTERPNGVWVDADVNGGGDSFVRLGWLEKASLAAVGDHGLIG